MTKGWGVSVPTNKRAPESWSAFTILSRTESPRFLAAKSPAVYPVSELHHSRSMGVAYSMFDLFQAASSSARGVILRHATRVGTFQVPALAVAAAICGIRDSSNQ